MKTIVIAAGYATRLYPLTENFPKPLLEIGKSTILDRMLDDIDTIPEIEEHIVVTNGKFAPIFEKLRHPGPGVERRDFYQRGEARGSEGFDSGAGDIQRG